MKPKPTLQDFIHAARNEKPVVSFDESASRLQADLAADRQARRASRRKRSRFMFWWTDTAQATPRLIAGGFQTLGRRLGEKVTPALSGLVVRPPFASGMITGVAATIVLGMLLTNPTHDTSYQASHGTRRETSYNGSSSTERAVSSRPPQANIFSPKPSLTFSPKSPLTSSLAAPPQVPSPANNLAVNRTESHSQAIAAHTSEQTPHRPIVPVQDSVRSVGGEDETKPTTLSANVEKSVEKSADKNVDKTSEPVPEPLTKPFVLPSSDAASLTNPFSLEYRVAARTATQTTARTEATAGATFAAAALQAMNIGAYYALDEHHSIGLEAGLQPFSSLSSFSSAVANPLLPSLTTNGTPTLTTINTGVPANVPPTDAFIMPTPFGITAAPTLTTRSQNQPPPAFSAIQPESLRSTNGQLNSSNTVQQAPWFAAAYQYSADAFSVAGIDVKPLARLSLGGGAAGALGRMLLGIQYAPSAMLRFLLAAEGTALASAVENSVQNSAQNLVQNSAQSGFQIRSQAGVTLGVGIKF
jgi:hypothetical protein